MSELTEALIAIAKGGCECKADECDGTCGPAIAERAAKRIAGLGLALSDLLTGIDVHNGCVAGRADIPVPRIEGPIVDVARKVLKGGA